MKMKSASQYSFARVPQANIPRSAFKRNWSYKGTLAEGGVLYPFLVDEVLPGSTWNYNATVFARLTTPVISPILDNATLSTFFFFVPNRLVWDNWVKMMGEREDPVADYESDTEYIIPTVAAPTSGGFANGSLYDYFGIPTEIPDIEVSNLFARGYSLIWNKYFRDENLQDSVTVDKGDGPDDPTDYVLLRRNKAHDYFTSALPWPQKGPSVSVNLTGDAPVSGIGKQTQVFAGAVAATYETDGTGAVSYPSGISIGGSGNNDFVAREDADNAGFPDIRADLSSVSGLSINDLRESLSMQELFERDARGGTRYPEILKSHFGVIDPAMEVLQYPVYLGGSTVPVIVTPIAQTAPQQVDSNDAFVGNPAGTLSGFATAVSQRNGFTKSFTEHGMIIGLVCIDADLTYQTGIPRMFSRSTRYDFYWPSLAHLGEQAVLNKEIYAVDPATDTDSDGTPDNDEVFGFQERWSEYKFGVSKIVGQLRSNFATSLDYWHLSQDFGATAPALNSTFIESNPPFARVVAVQNYPHFLLDSLHECTTVLPMPMYCIPGLGSRL